MRVLHDEISAMDDSLYSDLKAMEDRLRANLYSAMKLLADELRYDLRIMESRIVCAVRIAALSRVP
jgi:hypothetical protein